ncbi:hypothetical protein RHMOL_Rhmol08G0042400 [Rhododendron molle]|uniref:Uncharacterized protein n=1 Tax=Rhododendron molle TaxID=49168 RepID=A0ACC0MJQ0_RHOML|nr:hypothetical protein RHMOL_Rhmol08G0042400 [Rhododendron molle]
MASALPRFVTIQSSFSNKTYLRYVHEDGELHQYLQASGVEIVSPYAKFEIERPKNDTNGFVHIRSCYNNKYWVLAGSGGYPHYIIAAADEPNEDQSDWSCTLFEPIRVADGTFHFRHGQLGRYLSVQNLSAAKQDCLRAINSTSVPGGLLHVFSVGDWASLLILPKHIALKGDNDLYLSARTIQRYPYLQFASSDHGDPTVGNEVFITKDGSIRIKNNHFGKFWRRSPNWIWADSDDTTTDNSDTLFSAVKVGDNVIALRNLGNSNFCKRLTTEGKTNCLNAAVTTISQEARLVVEELVISRKIDFVNFRLLDARIYNQNIITMATKSATNDTQESNTATLSLVRRETKSNTWNASISLTLGVTTTITTGIPFIAEGKIEVSTEFTSEYQWGRTVTTETEVGSEYTITVPPMSKVTEMGCPRNSIIYHKLPNAHLDCGLVELTGDIDLLDMLTTHEGFNVPIEVYVDSHGMYNGSEDDEEEFNVPRESDPDTEHEGDEGDSESDTSGLVMSSEENEEYDVPIEEEVQEVQKRVCIGSKLTDDLSDVQKGNGKGVAGGGGRGRGVAIGGGRGRGGAARGRGLAVGGGRGRGGARGGAARGRGVVVGGGGSRGAVVGGGRGRGVAEVGGRGRGTTGGGGGKGRVVVGGGRGSGTNGTSQVTAATIGRRNTGIGHWVGIGSQASSSAPYEEDF